MHHRLTPLLAVWLTSLLLFQACTSTNQRKTPPRVQQLQPAPPPASLPPPANQETAPFRASGQSNGLTLFGFVKLILPSKEKARASLYSHIGRDVSDSTIALQKQSVESSERNFFIFSLPRVQLEAEVIRHVPPVESAEGASEIPNAPLRRGVPVFAPH